MKLPSFLATCFLFPCLLAAAEPAGGAAKPSSPWGDFVEKDSPFFSSVLDARTVGTDFPKDNLTPRGLVLHLGANIWACFDTELLRISAIWEGEEGKPPVTPAALAPGSYHVAGQKTKDGQEDLPKPVGKVLLANGLYPGWQIGSKATFTDPRKPAPSVEEVGRGPLDHASFQDIHFVPSNLSGGGLLGSWRLAYSIDQLSISEDFSLAMSNGVGSTRPKLNLVRQLHVPPHQETLTVVVGKLGLGLRCSAAFRSGGEGALPLQMSDGIASVVLPASTTSSIVLLTIDDVEGPGASFSVYTNLAALQSSVEVKGVLSAKEDAYVIDEIPLPVPNVHKRNVRLADIAFLNAQGDAAAVTFDGDVWMISGLKGNLEKVVWKRFASGLHEPMSIVARQGELFVFDRNGIWRLHDANKDGYCERHELFCNLFAQTAETREFPNSMKLGPEGEFYISKGGQEGTTRGKHNGTVIKVAADGKSIEVIGYGLRQPFIGVNPKTGLVTASDQQGHYVPSTPLHIISGHRFYGHLPTIAEKEKYPEAIAEPLTWIPHPVNPSGATQTWLLGAQMGPLNDELIHVGYNRPELFRVLMNTRFPNRPQAAVVSFSRDFDFGPLNALVNPADGQLYVTGFQVWGTTAKKLSGLVRVRYTNKPRVLLKEVTPTDKGLLLRFNAKLDVTMATDPSSYSAERWNYKRTPEYGSPHLKLDGSAGQEWLTASSAYLSKDGMTVLVGFPNMKAGVHEMRIGWGLKSVDGLKAENTAYFSPWELQPFDAEKEGFDEKLIVDLTPRASSTLAAAKPTAEEGQRLYQMFGCMACHSTDGTLVGKVGPSWKGLYGAERDIAKGMKGKVKADEAYLRESIINPSAKVVKGFEKFDTGMPIYAGILNDSQIDSLILFIKSLK